MSEKRKYFLSKLHNWRLSVSVKNNIKRTKQVDQSINLLILGLIRLMNTKPLEKITISELTKEAGLSRRTFYRHFQSIDDILTLKVEQIVDKLYQRAGLKGQTLEEVLNDAYHVLLSDKVFLQSLLENNHEYLLQKVILQKCEQSTMDVPHDQIHNLTAYFGAGGISFVIIYWIHQGFNQKIEEVKQANKELVTHIKKLM
ncbi:TetR/AcrR family transcriptional regulator [Fructobacillus americanaquae]|uniref:TetR family transcriptional regulator n=1 Tax=Fructobacillus americanaquae TaxID=2940302 RepID=A0ABY5C0M6_9LACO|nr:TetR family transcriptional regulator [Fructobacillus americanaquae]USS91733.1 TetR family transcriptional regulator [Fructobacillus americanaquae]